MKKREGYILWTVYFDSTKTWSQGRRVPRRLAVEKPSVEELVEAARRAGYQASIEEGKHPAWWFEDSGRVVVKADEKKSVVIRRVAEELVKIRASTRRARGRRGRR